MKKKFIVYEAVNVVNGNRYVGATSRGLAKRKSQHIADAFRKRPGCRALNAAIRKYGEDAFEWNVLRELSSFEDMMNEEIELIAELSPEYNITRGGRGIVGVPRTPEWMAKVRAALKGRKLSQAQVELMRKMDKSHQFKSIVCLDDGRFFESIKAAAEFYDLSKRGIGEMLHGRQVRCGGLSFAYSDAPLDSPERERRLAELKARLDAWDQRRNSDKRRPVICLKDNVLYESGRYAAKKLGVSPSRVMQLCQSGASTPTGLSFSYLDEWCPNPL